MREVGYSHLLFSELRKVHGDKFIIGLGANMQDIHPGITAKENYLLSRYMPKSHDLYPDLAMFQKEILDLDIHEISRLKDLSYDTQPEILAEWKFTSSFPSMNKGVVFADTAKLEILGEYLWRTKGKRPNLLQVIFNFPSRRSPQGDLRIAKWFESNDVSKDFPNVKILMILPDYSTLWLGESKIKNTNG